MGRGRVNLAPPAPINSTQTMGKKREWKNDRKREGNRERERETDSVERETTKTEKHKNRGYRLGNLERQTGRRNKRNRRDKSAGKKTPTGVSTQWRRSATTVTRFHCHRHRSATENSHQYHRQLSHSRSSPQVNSLPLLTPVINHLLAYRTCTVHILHARRK